MKKSWLEKLQDKQSFPKILNLTKGFPCYNALKSLGVKEGGSVVLVNPSEIIEIMAQVPRGKLVTIREICRKIAASHNVDGCCTLVAGIHITAIANAAWEAKEQRTNKEIADIPYWRTLKAEGFLNEKFPLGAKYHKQLLEKEGFKVTARGKKFQVADFQNHIFKI